MSNPIPEADPSEAPEITPGKLVDYQVEETSAVPFGANGRDFLVRKGLSDEQIAQLRAAGVAINKESDEQADKSVLPTVKEITNAVKEALQPFLSAILKRSPDMDKVTTPDPQETKKEEADMESMQAPETAPALTEEDWARIQSMIEETAKGVCSHVEKRCEDLEKRFEMIEQKSGQTQQMAEEANKNAEAATQSVSQTQEVAKSLAESIQSQTEMISKAFNSRPAGAPPAAVEQEVTNKQSAWANSGIAKTLRSIG